VNETRALIEQLVGRLREKSPAVLKDSDGVYQFHLTGDDGGDFALVIDQGEARLETGSLPNPGVTVTVSAQDFRDMVSGRLNAMGAFMAGRLQVAGNMGLAMRLSALL
jgi:putative sterol carrier protein